MDSGSKPSANNKAIRVMPRKERRDVECFVLLAKSGTPASPFWAKVSMPGLDGARCWQWTGDLTPKGACLGRFIREPAEADNLDRTLWVQPVHEWLSVVTVDVPLDSITAEIAAPAAPRKLLEAPE